MGRTEADIQAAQLLAGFGGAGFAPATSKGLSFRPPAFGRGQPLPLLARVAEEGDTGGIDGGAPLHAPLQTSTPPQQPRPQRCGVTPLTVASGPQHQDGGPMMQELPPLQSPLPPPMRPSGAMPRGGINRTETADSYTSQALREYAAGKAGGKLAGSGRLPGKAEPMFVGPSRPRTAAARALLAGTTLHPVVRLGWKPLCEVHCNGLTGFFLGGHDRDLYIKCTSAEYRYLPMVDVSQGGCIMTCSHFEKAAGRELSKKWKESIHVAGEGEGSKATLVSWLKRRAEADFGAAVVGCHVWVCWCADAEYYMGEIISYSRENGKHKVKYSDRFVEELHLPVEKLDFGPTKPTISFDPADCGFSELAQRQAGDSGSINRSRSAPAATLRAYAANYAATGLLHQCSNVSASSDFNEEQLLPPGAGAAAGLTGAERPVELRRSRLRDTSPTQASPTLSEDAQHAMRLPPVAVSRRRRTGVVLPEQLPADAGGGAGSSSVSEESDATPGAPPPKKRRSGSGRPSAAGQDFAARLADADAATHPLVRMGSLEHAGRANSSEQPSLERGTSLDRPRPSAPSFSAWSPAERKAVVQHAPFASPQSLASAPLQPALTSRAPPPATGHDEANAAVMSRWMNRVAMALDDVLVARAPAVAAAADRDLRGDGELGNTAPGWAASPSARFQALLVHARRHDCLPGYYEAMLERWDFFKELPAVLDAKMADLILAFCASGEQPPTPGSPPRAAVPARSASPQEASDAA